MSVDINNTPWWRWGTCSDRGRTSQNPYIHKSSNIGGKNVKINLFRILEIGQSLETLSECIQEKIRVLRNFNLPYSPLPLPSSAVTLKTGSYESQQQSAPWRRQRGLQGLKILSPENWHESPAEQHSGKAPFTGLGFFFFFLTGLGGSGWEKPEPQDICLKKNKPPHSCLG